MRTAKERQSAPPAPLHYPALPDDDMERQHAAASVLQKHAKSPDAKARRRTLPASNTPSAAGGRGGGAAVKMTIGVRIRPLSSKETKRGSNSCISTTEGKHVFVSDPDEKMNGRDYLRLDKNKDKAYQFDCAFGPEQTTEEVYNATVKRVIAAVMDGFHGSCFVRPPSSDLTFAPSLLHLQAPLSRSLRHGPSSAGVWCHR